MIIIARYKPSNTMRQDELEPLLHLPLIGDAIRSAEERHLKAGEMRADGGEPHNIEPNIRCLVDETYYDCLCDNGQTCIVHCETTEKQLTIPDSVEGFPVTAIGPHAFSTCYTLEQVTLPESVEKIGGYAFMNTALDDFDAPPSLRAIGASAFYKCNRLENVTLNQGLESIGDNAFRESALTNLTVPSSVEHIGHDAFRDTCLIYRGPDQTLHIAPDNSFCWLDNGALYRRVESGSELAQVLDDSLETYDGPQGLVSISKRAFAARKNMKHVTVPEGVKTIEEAAFKGCKNLSSVTLPETLESIGKHAFWDTSLESLRIPASLVWADTAAFYTGGSIANNFERTIRKAEVANGNKHFYLERDMLCWHKDDGNSIILLYTGDDERIIIPREVTAIGPYAFLKAKNTHHLVIHDALNFIDVGGLDFGRAIADVEYLVYADADHPVKRYRIAYPPGKAGWEAARLTFSRGSFNLAYAYAAADNAILVTQDTFNRSKAMLERLSSPVMLDERMRTAFEEKLKRSFIETVVAFGRNGFPQGIDLLLEFGLLNQDNINDAIEAASEAGEIAVLSRLVEIRRVSFETPLFDFDL